MNYRLTLVYGEGASFLLQEWPAGGVEIDDAVAGLFEAEKRDRELARALEVYEVKRALFDGPALLKAGLVRSWQWRGIGWEGKGPLARRAEQRIGELLTAGFPGDRESRVRVLRLIQAAMRELGPPSFVEGRIKRASGREERVRVYASGIVTYDRTPHPIPLLQELGALARAGANED